MGFNRIILEGRLTKDVELRYSQSGVAMAKGSIAVGKKFTSNGETKEKTLFVNLQFWKRSAEIFNQYCRKGSRILVEGELENSNWEDNNGNKRYDFIVNVTSLQMLDSKGDNQEQPQSQQQPQSQAQQYPQGYNQQVPTTHETVPKNSVPSIDIDEDSIPFNEAK